MIVGGIGKMAKEITYKIRYYHYSEEEVQDHLDNLLYMIEDLIPDCEMVYEPSDPDYGVITVKVQR